MIWPWQVTMNRVFASDSGDGTTEMSNSSQVRLNAEPDAENPEPQKSPCSRPCLFTVSAAKARRARQAL